MNETWRPAVGFETSYEVSTEGRVRGIDRVVQRRNGSTMPIPGRILKPVPSGRGDYLTVSLVSDGGRRTTYIHRLVALTFLGPCPQGQECCHNNGDGRDNRLANLRWDTPTANAQDKLRHGTDPQRKKTHCPAGHPYSPENTYVRRVKRTGGYNRACRTCHAQRTTKAQNSFVT